MRTGNTVSHSTSRRQFLLGAFGVALAWPLSSRAQGRQFTGREVVSSSFGGAGQEALQKTVFDWFNAQTGGRATQVPLLSAQAFARMRAEVANPQIDMFMYSGGQEEIAKAEGLTQPIAAGQHWDKIPAGLRDPDRHWITWGVISEGILYRTDKIKEAPTSYKDFLKEEYKGHVAFPHVTNGYGTDFLVMLARAFGGGEANIDPGFQALAKLAPDATIFRAPTDVQNLFAQGDTWIMPYDSASAVRTSRMGLPIGFATPSEGAPMVLLTATIAKNSKNADMASVLIDRMLSPESQVHIAQEVVWGPSNPDVQLPPDLAKFFPRIDQLARLDRDKINASRAAWTDRWNREIAKG